MRLALWLLAIFAAAVGIALFATRSTGTVTLFWPPYRIDLSLNLTLLLLVALFVLLYLGLRAVTALAELPTQARNWRATQRRQAMHAQLRDGMAHLLAGRFSRAKKQALQAHSNALALAAESDRQSLVEVQSLALLIAAEAAQNLQDVAERERLLKAALEVELPKTAAHFKEGAMLRGARWVLDENDPHTSLQRLASLSQGTQRRTIALRLKLRALQLKREPGHALETARLLTKHGAFSRFAAQSIVQSLAISMLSQAHDADQLHRAWIALADSERAQSDIATHAALRLVNLSVGSPEAEHLREMARAWIEPIWQRYPQLTEPAQIRIVRALEASFADSEIMVDHGWLAKIENAQRQLPHDPKLQYLAGVACLRRQLWGKAQQLLAQCTDHLGDEHLNRSAWISLAHLADQRGDTPASLAAWKNAAQARA
jgi:HemY protein